MKKWIFLVPIGLMSLTGCDTVNKMNRLVEESTCSIQANAQATQYSTMVIQRNRQVVEESSKTIEENNRLIQKASQ